jgi:hypothetical protein
MGRWFSLLLLLPLAGFYACHSAHAQSPGYNPPPPPPPPPYASRPAPAYGAPVNSGENCGTPDEPKPCPPLPRHPLPSYPANKQ